VRLPVDVLTGTNQFLSWVTAEASIIEKLSTELTIIFEEGQDGFWVATIPEVPGAFSQGRTKAEARQNVIEAMDELMAVRRDLALKESHDGATFETISLRA
jgi:predicted RNase H-like HicB family nuclease